MYDDSISMYFQYLDGGAIEDKFATSNNIDDALVKAGTTTGSPGRRSGWPSRSGCGAR